MNQSDYGELENYDIFTIKSLDVAFINKLTNTYIKNFHTHSMLFGYK
jgi:hypothetical protein